ncbi:MAG: FAD-dependent oxidoreductase [Faecalibacterium sp.]
MKEVIAKSYDIVIVGGGMSGLCAAISAARHGAQTALVQNRPVLGGNASSEIKMHICGADVHGSRPGARETGLLEEILLRNRSINPTESFSIFDTVLWEKATFQEGLDLYLNTNVYDVTTDGKKIISATALQQTTEKHFCFAADTFIDATGDGVLSALAGAKFMYGREGKDVFGETLAPEQSDNNTMGNTLFFTSKDVGHPVPFVKPDWANTYTEADLAQRDHAHLDAGYWWVELGGKDSHVIEDGEVIRDALLKAVYGIWDHIKNGGNHGAENLVLDWVGMLPGKRESRRVMGEYILIAQDLDAGTRFADAVAYGGWPMDMHDMGGLHADTNRPNVFHYLKDVYTIPYRSLIAKDFDNLLLAGRNISASNMAFGSTRVMGTCAVIGQAAGTAAALAHKQGIAPLALLSDIKALQQTLLRDDCYIPGVLNQDENDIVRYHSKTFTCSHACGTEKAANLNDGIARDIYTWAEGGQHKPIDWDAALQCVSYHGWRSGPLREGEQWVCAQLDAPYTLRSIHIKFDTNLSMEIKPELEDRCLVHQRSGMPKELVKDFTLTLCHEHKTVYTQTIRDNIDRFVCITLPSGIYCDRITITPHSTYGAPYAKIFELRAYE